MSQKKQPAPQTARKRPSAAAGSVWQRRPDQSSTRLIVVLAVVGVLAILGGWFLQQSGLLSINSDQAAMEGNAVLLSEIMSENLSALVTEDGNVPDWIEITNTGSEPVHIGKYALALESNINRMFSFPERTLAPGEYLLIHAAGADVVSADAWSAPFKLPASGNDTLLLLNAQGKVVDGVALPELAADESYVRQADGSWRVSETASPGAAEAIAVETGVHVVSGAAEISEAMTANTLYFADEQGLVHDYIEIRNTTGADLDLTGWYLSDSSAKLRRWAFPQVTLPAGGCIAVHCSGESRTDDPAHLHADFKLSSKGETLYLSQPDGQTVSMVTLPELLSDQAYSLADGVWTVALAPTPGRANDAQNAALTNLETFGDKSGSLCLSEIVAAPVNQDYDWLELYNGSAQAIDLANYGLSDDSGAPRKWQFPAGTVIQPGQYLGVILSGETTSPVEGQLNADFALAADGCYTLCLSDPQGRVLDAVYMPRQYAGNTFGRMQGQSGFYYFDMETPMAANMGSSYLGRADEPAASVPGGMYTSGDAFTVTLSAPAGSRIYYTLDCSEPTESSTPYTGPIEISGTTILRSRAYRDGYLPSYADTQSYLYDVQTEGDVYVVSVVSDMNSLMGEGGLLSDYLEKIEIPGHVEVFAADGSCAVGQNCGLALHGQDSRKKDVKSFDIIARTIYGDSRFDYPLFSERDYTSYQSFLLRPSGEDQDMSFMRDTVLTSLMRGSSVLFQEHEVAVMYLNGQYYTLCYMRERINEHSISQFEGWVDVEDEIDLIKANTLVNQGSNDTFETLRQWVRNNDTSTDEAYELIDSQIDIQNFIEYMSLQIFVGNTDTLNVRRYRCDETDGKWRWALYDLDWAFFNDTDSIGKWLTPGGTGAGRATDNSLFIGCMKNPTFREQFLTHFGQQMATTFTTENVVAKFDAQQARIAPMLPQYQQQWNYSLSGVKKVYSYAEERPTKIIKYFRDALDLSDADMQKYFGEAIEKIQEYESRKADS